MDTRQHVRSGFFWGFFFIHVMRSASGHETFGAVSILMSRIYAMVFTDWMCSAPTLQISVSFLLTNVHNTFTPRWSLVPRDAKVGISDGEVMERLWSYLRSFSRMTKEMRPSHRVDVLARALAYFGPKKKEKYKCSTTINCTIILTFKCFWREQAMSYITNSLHDVNFSSNISNMYTA